MIRAHPHAGAGGENEVAVRVASAGELGRAPRAAGTPGIRGVFRSRGIMPTALLVVPAAVVRVEATGVDRQRRTKLACDGHPFGELVQQPSAAVAEMQSVKSAAERVVVRYFPHADAPAPVLAVTQKRLGLAVAFALMFANNQAGEQLSKGEVFAAEFAGVLRQRLRAEQKCRQHHLPW